MAIKMANENGSASAVAKKSRASSNHSKQCATTAQASMEPPVKKSTFLSPPFPLPPRYLTEITVPSRIESLPTEMHHTLLDFLDPTTSAALAIACPTFYQLHRNRHGSVPLTMIEEKSAGVVFHGSLHELLADWMGKEGVELKFSRYNQLFVSIERWHELDEAMWSDGWESS
jgi:hypothetical protein